METILNQITSWSMFGFTVLDIFAIIFVVIFNIKKTNKISAKTLELLGKKELPKEIELDIKEHISSETRTELAEVKSLLKTAIKAESYILQTFKSKNWLNGEGVPKAEIDEFLSCAERPARAVIKLVDKVSPNSKDKLTQTENTEPNKKPVY